MNASPGTLTDPSFSLVAPIASTTAVTTDHLFTAMLVICGCMAVLLAVLIVWFSVRFREGNRSVDRNEPPSHAYGLEAAWTAAPMAIFLVIFAWAAYENVQQHRVPADALPVYLVAKQWMWRLQHANGRQEVNELHVPIDQPVVLVMASQDVIHSFYVPAFRVKQDVLPGRYTRLWFTATQLGEYRLLCTEYCGSQHSGMIGRVVVMPQADYAHWLETGPGMGHGPGTPAEPAAAASAAQGNRPGTPPGNLWDNPQNGPLTDATPQQLGAALYQRMACGSCHDASSSVHAPSLAGLYGRRVRLADGSEAVADDEYLRQSIVAPKRDVVQGQPNIMPSYAGQLDEESIEALVAYLRSLRSMPGDGPTSHLPVSAR